MSWPLVVSSQEISEFEFHISPVPSSSSPQVAVRNAGTRASSVAAWSRSVLRQTGLCTA